MKKILLIIVWIWVILPLGWGVYQTARKSAPLFAGQSETAPKK